jgi:hypothetical protein
MRKDIGAAGRILTKRLRAIFARVLVAVPFIGATMVSSAEGRAADDEPAIARLEQIRHQLRVQDGKMASSSRRQLAQWYNFPNWMNWKNWNDWDNSRNRR